MKKLLKKTITLLTAVSLTGCLGGDEEGKEEEVNPDGDGDGMLDEWEDV